MPSASPSATITIVTSSTSELPDFSDLPRRTVWAMAGRGAR